MQTDRQNVITIAPWSRRWVLKQLGYLGLAGLGAGIGLGGSWLSQQPQPALAVGSGQPLPEFAGISQWLNSAPLKISDLRGQVVLIQFWTLGCINCQRTLPSMVSWQRQYAQRGLKIIGIHTPEFAYERDIGNIRRAMEKYNITYSVAVDNQFKTWSAYQNRFWPHLFLADRQGNLQYDHIGEGAYDRTEQKIRQLLSAK
jgi:thiol-disulfide isomerase/thioredoxin